jgi:hypothetical protein
MRRKRLAVMQAAALALIGLVSACGEPAPSPSQTAEGISASATPSAALETASPSPTPTPTPTPTPFPSGPTLSWTTILSSGTDPKLAAKLQGGLSAAVAFGDGFVLAGSEGEPGKAVIWYSPDGASWQAIDNVPGFADGTIRDLVIYGGGLLAVGTSQELDRTCADPTSGCNPVYPIRMWASTDGKAWRELPGSTTASFGRAQLDLVAGAASQTAAPTSQATAGATTGATAGPTATPTATPSVTPGATGLVAFGELVPATGDTTPMVWTSTDGRSWVKAAQFSSAFGTDTMLDLAAGPNGYAAVGGRWVGGNVGQPRMAWHSADGKSWQLAAGLESGYGPSTVWVCAGGFLGVDSSSGSAAFWVSADGSRWSARPNGSDRPDYPADVSSGIYSDGSRIVVIGADWYRTPGAWITSDGVGWQPLVRSGPQPPIDQAAAGSVVGAFGKPGLLVTEALGSDPSTASWTFWLGTIE